MKWIVAVLLTVGLGAVAAMPAAAQSARVSVKLGNQAVPGQVRVRDGNGQVGPWRPTNGSGVYMLATCTANMQVNASLQSGLGSIDGPQWRDCSSNPEFRFNSFLMAGIVGADGLPSSAAQLAQLSAAGVYDDVVRLQSRLAVHFKNGRGANLSVEAMELAELYYEAGLTDRADAYAALAVEAGAVVLANETEIPLDAPAIARVDDGSYVETIEARRLLSEYRRRQDSADEREPRWDEEAFADIADIAAQNVQADKAQPR